MGGRLPPACRALVSLLAFTITLKFCQPHYSNPNCNTPQQRQHIRSCTVSAFGRDQPYLWAQCVHACLPGVLCRSSNARACSSSHSLASYIFLVLHVLFIVDIFISFRVAFHENEDLITDPWATARNYRRRVTETSWPDVFGECAPRLACMYFHRFIILTVARDASE